MRADHFLPDVLADRNTQFHALELDRLGHGSGREDPLLVEGPVVGELALQRAADDLPSVGEDEGVIV